MAKTHDSITPNLRTFIEEQPIFFVATAPRADDGHVNLSPKGYDTFRVVDENRVAYLDLTGSGNETSAHLLENGRITFMWCSFGRVPKILRLYGQGRTVLPGTPDWEELDALFPDRHGARQIILANITRVQTSCGYSVPRMDLVDERATLQGWAKAKTPEQLAAYQREKNAESIDGLPTALGTGS